MQDIRAGLKERLESTIKERVGLQARLAETEQVESTLRTLLRQEESKFGKLEPTLPFNGTVKPGSDPTVRGGTPLSRMILGAIQEANRPLMLDDFKQAAEKIHYDFGAKKPGRVLHWALVGLEESKILERAEGGGYKMRRTITQ